MKKNLILLTLFILTGCTPKLSNLSIELVPQVDTIELGDTYIDLGAIATYGPNTLDYDVIFDDLDTDKVGVYERTYQVTYGDLSKTITRVIHVIDQTPPTVTLNAGIDTILLGDTWIDESVTVTDQSNLAVTVETTGTVLNEVGTYIITYKATDAYQNETVVNRIVTVIEQP